MIYPASPKPRSEEALFRSHCGRVDRRRVDLRMPHPALGEIERHTCLQGANAKRVTKTARRGAASADLAEHHHALDDPSRSHAMTWPQPTNFAQRIHISQDELSTDSEKFRVCVDEPRH
jgi:hypothetical protein